MPVFALGRAQELLILIESYWERMKDLQNIPIYFSAGLTERANDYYKLFISWTNEKLKKSFCDHNMFDFRMIKPWKPEYADEPGPKVLFASPGMLHAGTSLQVFTKWCHDPLNTIIMPGYCVAGTVGAKVLAGQKEIDIDKFTRVFCNMQIKNLSFSAHADAKGIMALVSMAKAKNVMLVHGEKAKMAKLKKRIEHEMGIPCFDPANGETITIEPKPTVPLAVPDDYVESEHVKAAETAKGPIDKVSISGCVVLDDNVNKKGSSKRLRLIPQDEAFKRFPLYDPAETKEKTSSIFSAKQPINASYLFPRFSLDDWKEKALNRSYEILKRNYWNSDLVILKGDTLFVADTIRVSLTDECEFYISWSSDCTKDAADVMSVLNQLDF